MLAYIHVPFCSSKCSYCAFYSKPSSDLSDFEAYLKMILKEIKLTSQKIELKPIESIFFGGGTPSLLPPHFFEAILNCLGKFFTIKDQIEINAEANPESAIKGTWLKDCKEIGINRLSLGVQSLNNDTLKILGRLHNSEQAIAAYIKARQANFSSINLDFMWGLPGINSPQTLNSWEEELKTICKLEPDHVSAYGLSIEPNTKISLLYNNNQILLPSEEEQADFFIKGIDILESYGLLQYEISNFAKDGYTCKHNTKYWEGFNYIGLGPAATSTINNKRWTNPNLAEWSSNLNKELITVDALSCIETLSKIDQLKELIMLSLRTSKGLSIDVWEQEAHISFTEFSKHLIKGLTDNGLAIISNNHFSLTKKGMLVSNVIIERFFDLVEQMK